ncbi:hypothetical protein N7471_007284 [Penicillium samsonianum]|uniref:uncharacterized protein n=1 Tax=Penicillium samsonianum TaxID=1882272 RepID=UPI00254820EE|nr:uncharacterized protein N7471_007284 [Penicillium samsonianum]KAJ6132069.1 hypothetical protein N7471_007284 [Penicillium samsonianum]
MQGRHWFDPYYDGSNFALGDSAFIATETLAALFIFQLLCEEETKPVDAVHHVGGLLIILGYPAWTVSLPVGSSFTLVEAKAMAEICLLWVLFSDAYGAAKNTSHILRRCLQPASAAIGWLYFFAFYSILLSTALEAISVLYATSLSWDKLSTFYKLVIFVLQGLFTLAKSRTILPFYTMYRKQKAKHLGSATTGMSNPISLLP